MEDLPDRIYATQRAIATSRAKTLPDATVQLRRLAALLDGQEPERRLLASALAVVAATEAPTRGKPHAPIQDRGAERPTSGDISIPSSPHLRSSAHHRATASATARPVRRAGRVSFSATGPAAHPG